MARFDNAIAFAKRLIQRNGQVGTLRVNSETLTDPNREWLGGTITETTYPIDIVVLPVEAMEDDRLESGNFQERDRKWIIASADGLAVVPQPSNELTFMSEGSTKTWNIDSLSTLEPNGQLIIYEMVVTR